MKNLLQSSYGIWLAVALVTIVIAVLIVDGLFYERQSNTITISLPPDYSNHSVYSRYDFSRNDSVINIGLQPLYLPTSWIFEVVRRDTILKNALSELGKKAQFYFFLKGDDVNFFFRRGDIAAGVVGDMPALSIASTHEVIIPTMVQYGFTSIVANKQMLIDELHGQRIGFAYGSHAHFTVLNALASVGMTEKDVEFVAMETLEMPEALNIGRIDAFSSWEPAITVALSNYPNTVVIHRNQSSGYLYFSKAFYDKHPEAVRHIVASQVRALRWLQRDHENLATACIWSQHEAENLIGQNVELSNDQIAQLALNDILGASSIPLIPSALRAKEGPLHREFEFLKQIKSIPESQTWDVVQLCFDRTVLSEVMSNSAKYNIVSPGYVMEGMKP